MHRWLRTLLLGLLLAVVALLAFTTTRALQVRGDLTAARLQVAVVQHQLVSGELERGASGLPALRVRLDRAAGRTEGRVWALAERLPLVGRNFSAVRRVALSAQVLGDEALPEAEAALQLARRERVIRGGRVDLAVLRRLQARVDLAGAASSRALALLDGAPGVLLPPVGDGLAEARGKVADVDEAVGSARRALRLAPGMLGEQGPRHYFVAVQNNAEARATGGLIGAYALVTTDRGVIRLDRTGTNFELHTAAEHVPSDARAAKLWKDLGSTGAWYAANFTPHFPDAARNIAGLWLAQSGQQVDGVLALDPVVMRELLTATGPVRLPDGSSVDAGTVEDFVGHDEYVRYPDLAERKGLLSALAGTLFRKVVEGRQPLPLVQAFARVGRSGHFYAWSRLPQEQAELGTGIVGGALPTTDVPYLSVLTQNFAGNKLDFYVRRRVHVRRVKPGWIEVSVALRNIAPPGLPPYMTIRSDRPKHPLPYAQAGIGFSVYGALSSEVSEVRVDGKPSEMSFDRDHGHRMGTFAMELPRGKEVTVTVLISEPEGVLLYRQQPLVRPDEIDAASGFVMVQQGS